MKLLVSERDWTEAARIIRGSVSDKRIPAPWEMRLLERCNKSDKERYGKLHSTIREEEEQKKMRRGGL